jgi:hypothetical protein
MKGNGLQRSILKRLSDRITVGWGNAVVMAGIGHQYRRKGQSMYLKRLVSLIVMALLPSFCVFADYAGIPDYDWTITTITVNATAKRITAPLSGRVFIQAVGNDVYVAKNTTANHTSLSKTLKIINGGNLDLGITYIRKNQYFTIKAPSATIATVNYIISQ